MNSERPAKPRFGAAAVLAAGALGACAVGPNFKTPAAPALDRYPAAEQAGGPSIRLGAPTDPSWWRLFGSAKLDAMVEAGLAASPTLASARAALTESQDQARAGASVFFPSVGAGASAERVRTTPAQFGESQSGSTFSLYTLSGEVSYALDLFGGERRSVEALNAQADQQRNAVGAAYLLLTGDLVETAIARAGYADEATALTDIVRLDKDQRDALDAQYRAGHGALSAVLDADQQLAADQESLALTRQRQAAAETLLQTLLGREPAQSSPSPPGLDELAPPPEVPVSLPSQLVRQRPDILGAEANLHQASANIGVATAAMFPSISLTGDYGAASVSLASLAAPAARFWSVGPTIDVPIFRGGELWFSRKAAQAGYLKAAADYRQTVLAALEQVSDALKALQTDADVAAASQRGYDAAELAGRLADTGLEAGAVAGVDDMTSQIAADRARLALIAAKAQRLQDVAALYVACGGGWDGRSAEGGQVAAAK